MRHLQFQKSQARLSKDRAEAGPQRPEAAGSGSARQLPDRQKIECTLSPYIQVVAASTTPVVSLQMRRLPMGVGIAQLANPGGVSTSSLSSAVTRFL